MKQIEINLTLNDIPYEMPIHNLTDYLKASLGASFNADIEIYTEDYDFASPLGLKPPNQRPVPYEQ